MRERTTTRPTETAATRADAGIALIAVIAALSALLLIAVPFSMSMRDHRESATFRLPILASDVSQQNQSPPGIDSPFGTDGSCLTPL